MIWQEGAHGALGFAAGRQDGDTLWLRDLEMTGDFANGQFWLSIGVPELSLTETADNAVAIAYPPRISFAFGETEAVSTPTSVQFAIALENMQVRATGDDAQDLTYEYSADRLAIGELDLSGAEAGGAAKGDFAFIFDGVGGQSRVVQDTTQYRVEDNFTAQSFSYRIEYQDSSEGSALLQSGKIEDFAIRIAEVLPAGSAGRSFTAALFDESASFELWLDHGPGQGRGVDDFRPRGQRTLDTTSARSRMRLAIKQGEVEIESTTQEVTYGVAENGLPPFSVGMAQLGLQLKMPVVASEAERDAAFALRVNGFRINDSTWDLIDESRLFPRDPVNLEIDLAGKMRLLTTLFEWDMESPPPFDLHRLTLNHFLLDLLGAQLTGQGEVTFETNTPPNQEGWSPPIGQATWNLLGGQALLSRLADAGLIDTSMEAFVRGLVHQFTTVEPGEDSLSLTVEFSPEGHLLLNGQRLH